MAGIASIAALGALVIGSANPVLSQRAETTEEARNARGSTDGRATIDARGKTSSSGNARTQEAEKKESPNAARSPRTNENTQTDRAARTDRQRETDSARADRSRQTDRRDRVDRNRQTDRADRSNHNSRADRTRRSDRSAGSNRPAPSSRRVVVPPPKVVKPVVRPRPVVRIDISWPWEHRYRRGWSPTYRYRQVVYTEAGWGRRRHDARLDVRTYYRQRVRSASRSRAVVEFEIRRIEIYEDGRFVGQVSHIPTKLSRVTATLHRNGRTQLDRDLFIIGDPHAGFELISTRHYGGFLYDHYRPSHGYRAGVLDFRRGRVKAISRSRLFHPNDFRGFAPIYLLPEDEVWLGDYGHGAPSHHWYGDDDYYFYGYAAPVQAPHSTASSSVAMAPRTTTSGREAALPSAQPLQRRDDRTFQLEGGGQIRIQKEITLERVE